MPDPRNLPSVPSGRTPGGLQARRGDSLRSRTSYRPSPSAQSASSSALPDLSLPDLSGSSKTSKSPDTPPSSPRRTPGTAPTVPGLAPSRGKRFDTPRQENVPSSRTQERVVNEYDDGDDPFESIDVEDQVDVEDADDYEAEHVEVTKPAESSIRKDPKKPSKKKTGLFGKKNQDKTPSKNTPAPNKSSSSSTTENDDEDELGFKRNFIDRKNNRLLPFGKSVGSKGDRKKGRKIRDKDIDPRKNRIIKINTTRWIIILIALSIFGVGLYQAAFPKKPLTENQVAQVAQNTLGITNFPAARGEGFAKDFLQAYLTTGDDVSTQALGYFFNGTLNAANNSNIETNRQIATGYKQKILFGPTVYSTSYVTDQVATYVVGALVQAAPADGSTVAEDSTGHTGTEATWMFYSINVYYDKDSDRLFVTPDSPTVVPNMNVGNSKDLPDPQALGTGEVSSELKAKVSSTVLGFLSAYATSSPQDHTALDQYVINDAPQSLKTGLGGTYAFNGTVDNAVTFETYPTEDDNVVKVKAVVNWRRTLGGDTNKSASYTSTYVITLQNVSGKWLVSKFSPYTYMPGSEEAIENSSSESSPSPSGS